MTAQLSPVWRDLARIVGDAQRRLSEKKTAPTTLGVRAEEARTSGHPTGG